MFQLDDSIYSQRKTSENLFVDKNNEKSITYHNKESVYSENKPGKKMNEYSSADCNPLLRNKNEQYEVKIKVNSNTDFEPNYKYDPESAKKKIIYGDIKDETLNQDKNYKEGIKEYNYGGNVNFPEGKNKLSKIEPELRKIQEMESHEIFNQEPLNINKIKQNIKKNNWVSDESK